MEVHLLPAEDLAEVVLEFHPGDAIEGGLGEVQDVSPGRTNKHICFFVCLILKKNVHHINYVF